MTGSRWAIRYQAGHDRAGSGGRPSGCPVSEPERRPGDPADLDVFVFGGGGPQCSAAAFLVCPAEQPPGGSWRFPGSGSVSSRTSRAWKAAGSPSARLISSSSSARDRRSGATRRRTSAPGESSETSVATGPRGRAGSQGCPAPPGSRASHSCGTPAIPRWLRARPGGRPRPPRETAVPGPGWQAPSHALPGAAPRLPEPHLGGMSSGLTPERSGRRPPPEPQLPQRGRDILAQHQPVPVLRRRSRVHANLARDHDRGPQPAMVLALAFHGSEWRSGVPIMKSAPDLGR